MICVRLGRSVFGVGGQDNCRKQCISMHTKNLKAVKPNDHTGPEIVECSLWTICTVSHIWIVMNSLLMLWSQFLATSQTEMLSLNHDCKKKGKSNGKFQLAHLAEFFKCLQWRYSDFNGDYIPAILIKCIQDSQIKNFLTNFLNLNLVTFNWKIMTFYFKFF